jgi:uncharacterized protein YndB with AHSA1/START domain
MNLDATVVPDGARWTLIFMRSLRQPPAAVWTALTEPAEVDRWAPFAGDLTHLGATTLTMIDGADRTEMPAEVLRFEPPALLEYTWGADRLRWELEAAGAGTRLTLRHTLAEPGLDAMVAAGWHLCADVLQRLLDGEPVTAIRGQEALHHGWTELRDAYAAKFRS